MIRITLKEIMVCFLLQTLLGKSWKTVCSECWSREEHTTILECRTAVRAFRAICRSASCMGAEYVFILDSMACVLASTKGRSSSGLLRPLRQFAALSLRFDVAFVDLSKVHCFDMVLEMSQLF